MEMAAARRTPRPENMAEGDSLVVHSAVLNHLHLVAGRVFDEGDMRAAELHWAGLAHHLDALFLERTAGRVEVVHADRKMTEGAALIVGFGTPVVSQLDDGVAVLIFIADEGEREFSVGIVVLAQQLHPETVAVELERLIQIVDAD